MPRDGPRQNMKRFRRVIFPEATLWNSRNAASSIGHLPTFACTGAREVNRGEVTSTGHHWTEERRHAIFIFISNEPIGDLGAFKDQDVTMTGQGSAYA